MWAVPGSNHHPAFQADTHQHPVAAASADAATADALSAAVAAAAVAAAAASAASAGPAAAAAAAAVPPAAAAAAPLAVAVAFVAAADDAVAAAVVVVAGADVIPNTPWRLLSSSAAFQEHDRVLQLVRYSLCSAHQLLLQQYKKTQDKQ